MSKRGYINARRVRYIRLPQGIVKIYVIDGRRCHPGCPFFDVAILKNKSCTLFKSVADRPATMRRSAMCEAAEIARPFDMHIEYYNRLVREKRRERMADKKSSPKSKGVPKYNNR